MKIEHHQMINLCDYPVLRAIASSKTIATRLDARCCLHLYESAFVDIRCLSAHEKSLFDSLAALRL